MIMLTYKKAIAIQDEQLQYYGSQLRYRGKIWLYRKIKSMTKSCENPDMPMKVSEINNLVPRGGVIEDKFLFAIRKYGRSNNKSFMNAVNGWYW